MLITDGKSNHIQKGSFGNHLALVSINDFHNWVGGTMLRNYTIHNKFKK
jgi:hypothetical protein